MYKFYSCLFYLLSFAALANAVEPLKVDDPRWKWMDEQIEEQFAPFKNGITKKMIDETSLLADQISFGEHMVRIEIIKGKVFSNATTDVHQRAVKLLERVVAIYPVPDVDIICFPADQLWQDGQLKAPVFASALRKNGSPCVIHMPIQQSIRFEDEYVLRTLCLNKKLPWEKKIAKIFWRGQCNDGGRGYSNPKNWTIYRRGKLCSWSNEYPELIDAAFSGYQNYQVAPEIRGQFFEYFPLERASWEEYQNYKYLIDLDGVVTAVPGCAWKFLSNSAVFKHESSFHLYFYKLMEPWVHYIPLNEDISDLFEKLDWALEHDAEARAIAENGNRLALENIMPEHIYLYCYKALCKYASLQID